MERLLYCLSRCEEPLANFVGITSFFVTKIARDRPIVRDSCFLAISLWLLTLFDTSWNCAVYTATQFQTDKKHVRERLHTAVQKSLGNLHARLQLEVAGVAARC